jgi:hypothetical protein
MRTGDLKIMTDRSQTTRPSELDMVRVRGRNEPGTVVHIYPHHLAYEVEFPDGVVTVDAEHVEGVAGLPHSRSWGRLADEIDRLRAEREEIMQHYEGIIEELEKVANQNG